MPVLIWGGALTNLRDMATVVVAEDEALIRMDLIEMLSEEGYEVLAAASDGAQGLELVRQHRPDICIFDVKMPILDGISAAEIVVQERICPVVMLTAFSQRELIERARDAGVMAYVTKPFSVSDLVAAIELAVSRHQQLAALEAEVLDLHERLETRKALDRAKAVLMERLGVGEAEAFRWIQKAAMDQRISMKQVAEAVLGSR